MHSLTLLLTFILSILTGSVSAFKWCSSASQCIGQSIVDSSSVYAGGYKSIFGATTSITSNNSVVQCVAAVSCSKLSFLSISTGGDIHCSGSLSCYDITSVQHTYTISPGTSGYIHCSGANSCQSTTFTGSPISSSYPIAQCRGSYSCADSQFTEAKEIIGSGAYSLYNTIIHSTASSNIQVYLQGYHSGFGAKIYCQTGHQCYIYCYNNGCEMLYVECQDNCHIIINSVRTVLPIYNISHFNASKLNVFLSASSTTQNDATCSNAADQSFIYDNMHEMNPNDVEIRPSGDPKNPVCCRGDNACDGSIFLGNSLNGENTIICSGDSSCYNMDSIWSVGGTVSCSGTSACFRTPIDSDIVTCTGSGSCSGTTINARNIYCYGRGSCASTTIATDINYATLNLYFLGESSGSYASITCASNEVCHILCGGFNSCFELTVNCPGTCTFECNKDTECPPGSGITYDPTLAPTRNPTTETIQPTAQPSKSPTTANPTSNPTFDPTLDPTIDPTFDPTLDPTIDPTSDPTFEPTSYPTLDPTVPVFIQPNTSKLYRKVHQHAIGVWSSNVTLLGGESTVLSVAHQMQRYDVVNDQMIDYGTEFLQNNEGISGMQQFYTQNSNYLYMISGSWIYRYQLDTKVMVKNWANIPLYTYQHSCITSDEAANSLYIIGGYKMSEYQPGLKVTLDTVQVLDMSAIEWVGNVTALNEPRAMLTCNVHPSSNRLYAIGGFVHPTVDDINAGNTELTYLSSIEYLDINNMQQLWQNNLYSLPFAAANGVRSVVYANYIFVVGGMYDDNNGYISRLQIIDILSGTTSLGAEFNPSSGLIATGCVMIGDVIYAFGGLNGGGVLDSWQYHETGIPSMAPTSSPSDYPSTDPTKNPTCYPTTAKPSTDPTIDPTIDPTSDPTIDPSANPTIYPTIDPTLGPTENADIFQKEDDEDSDTTTVVIVIVCVFIVIGALGIFGVIYFKRIRNEQKVEIGNKIEGVYDKSNIEMEPQNENKSNDDEKMEVKGEVMEEMDENENDNETKFKE